VSEVPACASPVCDVDDETNSGNSTDTNIATMVSVDVDHINDASQTCCSAPNNESVGIVDITDIEMIQDILDSEICNLSVGWIASIPINIHVCYTCYSWQNQKTVSQNI